MNQLGFASQLVFTTWCLGNFGLDDTNIPLAYATAQAHNRMMKDYCAEDRRFLGAAYIPLSDFDRAKHIAREAIDMGLKALMIPSKPPKTHSASHIALEPICSASNGSSISCRWASKRRSVPHLWTLWPSPESASSA